jgi:ribose/xylose/arabinose/galactoside ABC-type transport system permease subunit
MSAGEAGPPAIGGAAVPWRRRIWRDYGSLLGLLVIAAVLGALSDRFLTGSNLVNVARQVSINAIVAAGMTVVIITGGIDLSVGSTIALAGCTALTAAAAAGDLLGMGAGLLAGGLVGFLNGGLVAWGRVPPFIATLATMTIVRGAALVLTNGEPIVKSEGIYLWLGQASVGPVPVPILLMIAVLFGAHWFLARTRWGIYVYAVGGNAEAARLVGISLVGVQILAYTIAGLLSGLAGLVLAARLSSAQPNTGVGFELDAIAAVVLGGTSLMGGEGTIWGTTVGAFIIGVLNNGFNLLNVSPFYQLIAKGVVIILAVLVDQVLKARTVNGPAARMEASPPAEGQAQE